MNERDIRAVERMSLDELRKAFKEFSIEEIEMIYMRIRYEKNDNVQSTPSKINCS